MKFKKEDLVIVMVAPGFHLEGKRGKVVSILDIDVRYYGVVFNSQLPYYFRECELILCKENLFDQIYERLTGD